MAALGLTGVLRLIAHCRNGTPASHRKKTITITIPSRTVPSTVVSILAMMVTEERVAALLLESAELTMERHVP